MYFADANATATSQIRNPKRSELSKSKIHVFFSTKRRHYEIAKQCQNSSAERSPLIVRNTCHKEQALTTHKEHVTRNASDKKRVHLRGLHLRVSYEIRHTPPHLCRASCAAENSKSDSTLCLCCLGNTFPAPIVNHLRSCDCPSISCVIVYNWKSTFQRLHKCHLNFGQGVVGVAYGK